MDNSKNIEDSVSFDFLHETCKINLANYVKNLKQNKNYFIEIQGPAFSNPYIFHNSETLFHM